jgi:hypothetical protein
MQEPRASVFKDFEFKERMFNSVIDLIVVAVFMGISPSGDLSITFHNFPERTSFLTSSYQLHFGVLFLLNDIFPYRTDNIINILTIPLFKFTFNLV